MFPLPILTYIKIGVGIAALALSWYFGYSFEKSRFDRYKLDQIEVTEKLKDERQAAADNIERVKNAQINDISNRLADALSQLRQRPARPKVETPDIAACGDGRSLYAEDAEFLIREAARADTIRAGLEACYKQYDAIAEQ